MNIRYIVELSEEERTQLHELTGGGQARVCRVKRAQILLAAEQGHGDAAVAALVGVGASTVYRTKRRFVEGGVEVALSEGPRVGGEAQAHRARGDVAGGGGVLGPAGRTRALDASVAGRRYGATHRTPLAVARDGTPTVGRAVGQALATQDVVHPLRRYRVRGADGRRARPVQRSPRPAPTGRLLR